LIADDLTGIRESNIAKFMNKAQWPSLHKTRVTGSASFRNSTINLFAKGILTGGLFCKKSTLKLSICVMLTSQ
jgi:hypothetical protein